jgi:hypothetical protein
VDWLGNTSYATETLVVEDVLPPVLVIPGDVTVPADDANGADLTAQELKILGPPPSGTTPSYSVTDNCGVALLMVYRDNPGPTDDGTPEGLAGHYPLGRSLITWIAYDDANNFTELFQEVYVEGSTAVTSPFTAGDENWTSTGTDVTAVSHSASGGNPGGYISATQPGATSSTWHFEAPSAYHGNMEGALHQTLTFDLKLNAAANVSGNPSVIINGGGLTIYASSGTTPTTSWGGQSVTLDTTTTWKIDDGDGIPGNDVTATNVDIQTVLGSVTSLKILGKFNSTAGATTSLDNVVLNLNYTDPTPTP